MGRLKLMVNAILVRARFHQEIKSSLRRAGGERTGKMAKTRTHRTRYKNTASLFTRSGRDTSHGVFEKEKLNETVSQSWAVAGAGCGLVTMVRSARRESRRSQSEKTRLDEGLTDSN